MRIIFENIDPKRNGEKIMVDPEHQGPLEARAMIAAYINSSNINPNGAKQDFGWRLATHQAAVVDGWLKDPSKALEVSQKYNIPTDDLKYYDYVMYLVDTAFEAETSKNKVSAIDELEAAEAAYKARVKALTDGDVIETPKVEPVATPAVEPTTPAPTTKKK